MTPREIRDTANKMAANIGERAKVYVGFKDNDMPITGSIYTNWPAGSPAVKVDAEDWAELFGLLQEAWVAHHDEYCSRVTKKLALKIIQITDEQGECTDAALRGGWDFTGAQVDEFGDAACAKADEMAGRGPFEIVRVRGANAA